MVNQNLTKKKHNGRPLRCPALGASQVLLRFSLVWVCQFLKAEKQPGNASSTVYIKSGESVSWFWSYSGYTLYRRKQVSDRLSAGVSALTPYSAAFDISPLNELPLQLIMNPDWCLGFCAYIVHRPFLLRPLSIYNFHLIEYKYNFVIYKLF